MKGMAGMDIGSLMSGLGGKGGMPDMAQMQKMMAQMGGGGGGRRTRKVRVRRWENISDDRLFLFIIRDRAGVTFSHSLMASRSVLLQAWSTSITHNNLKFLVKKKKQWKCLPVH